MTINSTSSSSSDNTGAGSTGKKPIGFAAMSPERHREIASMGGKAAHQNGGAHEFTTESAREAARAMHSKRAKRVGANTTT